MKLKISRLFTLVFTWVLIIGLLPVQTFADKSALPLSKVIINEIVLSEGNGPNEFATLYNLTEDNIDLDDWYVEYAKNQFSSASCDLPSWELDKDGFSMSLKGLVLPGNGALSLKHQLNNAGSGSLRITQIVDNITVVHDLVGWGIGAPCYDGSPSSMPSASKSIQRVIDCKTGFPVDTDNNLLDFTDPKTKIDNCEEESEGGMGGDPGGTGNCEGVVITEVLPNPAGADKGNEFIELYNSTSKDISLEDCKIEVGSKSYIFPEITIKPKQYLAFYDDVTGLTLSNSSGGSVYLVYGNTEHEVEYLSNLDDDVAWAFDLSSDNWSITYSLTPGAKNEIVENKPCPKGQFRNLETNRCNNISVEAGLGPCPAGKFRNPETNRCKNILAAGSQLTPCKPGQFRNPATNRCKSLTSGRSLVPCKPDQERNPETNRCRKVSGAAASGESDVKDVLSASGVQNKTSWAMAGFSFAGATTYALWEWRREMMDKLSSLLNKLGLK